MYQALQNGRSGEYRSSGQQGRLEVLSATRYSHDIFNNARGSLGNANASDTHDNVAGNQINNVNSPQTTSKTARDITSGNGGQGGSGLYGGAGGAGGNIMLNM